MTKNLEFLTSTLPKLEPVTDSGDALGKVKVAERIVYTFRALAKREQIYYYYDYTVLPGFVSDGASIPRFFWRVLGGKFTPKAWRAFIFHDWCYSGHAGISREDADAALRDILVADGFSRIKARLIYRAVRLFGSKYFKHE